MTAATYAPRPGSAAYRALAHLESLPHGTEITTGKLAEAIDVPSNNLLPCLLGIIDAGQAFRRQKDSHPRSPFFWSLVDHSKNTEGRGSLHVLKAEPERAEATDRETPADASPSVGSMGAGQPADEGPAVEAHAETAQFLPRGASRRAPRPAAALLPQNTTTVDEQHPAAGESSGSHDLRIALWSDGTLQIRRGAEDVVQFTAHETRELVRYLERMAESEVQA